MRRDDHPRVFRGEGADDPLAYFFLDFLSGAWLSADAAALLASFDDLGLLRTRLAAEAAALPVFSFLAILTYLVVYRRWNAWRMLESIQVRCCPAVVRLGMP